MIIPVILSGGSGTRLWPLSRETYPKQFLPLVDHHTMLQNTALRIAGLNDMAAPLVVCNEEHRFMVAEQLRAVGIQPAAVMLEPVGRNTAPAVAVAALHAQIAGADPTLLILPADHVIADVAGFRAAVRQVAPHAEAGRLITFGIVPTAPETGYGYIKAGAPLDESGYARWSASLKSPTPPPPSVIWNPAITTGTAACSCSALRPSWRNWSALPRRCWPPASRR